MNDFAFTSAEALPGNLSGIGRALVAAGTLDQKKAEMLYAKAHASHKSFVAELVDSGAVSSIALAHTLCKAFIAPLVDLSALNIEGLPANLLD